MRKLIQFGDVLSEGIFVFTPFEEEEEYPDEVTPSLLELTFADGAYRARGFDQSRKPTKTITKRFVLNDSTLRELEIRTQKSILGKDILGTKESYLSDFVDYVYRTLRGGVKRLYMITEDGTIRWTWAEAVSIPFTKSFSDSRFWQAFSIDFILHDPYWYEVGDGDTFYFVKEDLPFNLLVDPCGDLLNEPSYRIEKPTRFSNSVCSYNGTIIRDHSYVGKTLEECVTEEGCVVDEAKFHYGDIYSASEDTVFDVCVTGSAGSTRPQFLLTGKFSSPRITNLSNDYYLEYNGEMTPTEYLWIDLNSALSGEVEDMDYRTNISGFDVNNLIISNNGFFNLENGTNTLALTGVDGDVQIGINFFNRYHN